jgi:hypothetical protein
MEATFQFYNVEEFHIKMTCFFLFTQIIVTYVFVYYYSDSNNKLINADPLNLIYSLIKQSDLLNYYQKKEL